jgi:mRNA interferase MazF
MKRGDIVIVAVRGSFGKPRPAVVIQADQFNKTHATVLVCQMTSLIKDALLFRISVQPTAENGLREPSQIMVDKIATVEREKIGEPIGRLDAETLLIFDDALAVFVGLAD